jgi:hypothetical protein
MTPLDKTLKRSLQIKGIDFVVTLSPGTLKLTRKGRRLGLELKWAEMASGESALAVALHASLGRFESDNGNKPAKDAVRETNALSPESMPSRKRLAARSPMPLRRKK